MLTKKDGLTDASASRCKRRNASHYSRDCLRRVSIIGCGTCPLSCTELQGFQYDCLRALFSVHRLTIYIGLMPGKRIIVLDCMTRKGVGRLLVGAPHDHQERTDEHAIVVPVTSMCFRTVDICNLQYVLLSLPSPSAPVASAPRAVMTLSSLLLGGALGRSDTAPRGCHRAARPKVLTLARG